MRPSARTAGSPVGKTLEWSLWSVASRGEAGVLLADCYGRTAARTSLNASVELGWL